jgi:CheY-like chemotaxis protein
MSGAEVVERLRKSRSDITAIVVSDHALPELMQRAAANGAFACLCKPIAADELAQVVAEVRGPA